LVLAGSIANGVCMLPELHNKFLVGIGLQTLLLFVISKIMKMQGKDTYSTINAILSVILTGSASICLYCTDSALPTSNGIVVLDIQAIQSISCMSFS
jgi:hypothetical protein